MAEASTPTPAPAPVPAPIRNQLGRFSPGASGNPGGRTRLPDALRERLEAGAPEAVEKLFSLLSSEDDRVVLASALAILERLYGKPAQNSESKAETGSVQQAHLRALQDLVLRRKAGQDAVTVIDVPAAE